MSTFDVEKFRKMKNVTIRYECYGCHKYFKQPLVNVKPYHFTYSLCPRCNRILTGILKSADERSKLESAESILECLYARVAP